MDDPHRDAVPAGLATASPAAAAAPATPPTGLSDAEAQRRRQQGLGNDVPVKTSRTYPRIVRENVFNFINNVLFILGALLIILGRPLDALISVGVVVLNTIVSLLQEIRAKILLDRIAILTRPKATVVRDGAEREVDPSEIVLGDLLEVHTGDQIVVDGRLTGDGRLEADESLLTGESDLVPKRPGDELLSGSFVVTGGGRFVAERVGRESFAYKLTAGAQAFRRVLTPLQGKVHLIIRTVLLIALCLELMVVVKAFVNYVSFTDAVRMSVVVAALVPNGLILAIALSYALGAVRMAGKGALVQQANAVESLSNVDVLCTDKTGTLTTNAIRFHALEPFAVGEERLRGMLGDFASSAAETNRTSEALRDAFGGRQRTVVDEAAFSSARKWSALAIRDGDLSGTYVLGAPEMLTPALAPGSDLGPRLNEWTAGGLRVLLLAHRPEVVPLHPDGAGEGQPALPRDLVPLGLVSLSDELRPNVQDTLHKLSEAGVQLKIISGDNPQTVAALARQAGVSGDLTVVSGPELDELDDEALGTLAEETTVFGRITPEQKQRLVQALRARGHYVAMIGDGVNDVISLKQANVSVAMQGGSQAARAVADMVLLKDSFAALPWAFQEGQRIFNGMGDILRIFMVRIFSKALMIAAVAGIGGFALEPRQASLLSFFAAGIPAIALAAWAQPGAATHSGVLRSLARFTLPATLVMAILGVALYAGYLAPTDHAYLTQHPVVTSSDAWGMGLLRAQSMLTTFAVFCSLLLIPLTVPPIPFFTGGAPLRRDWKPTILAAGLLIGYLVVANVHLGQVSFDVAPLRWYEFCLAGGAAIVWAFVVRWMWRADLLWRFLGLRPETGETAIGL
jgi:cation-transporting ATPase E